MGANRWKSSLVEASIACKYVAASPSNVKLMRNSPMKIKVVIHEDETGGYWAEVPALPGCVTEGATREELLANLREAIEGILLGPPAVDRADAKTRCEEIDL
jgi:hypothetical protein